MTFKTFYKQLRSLDIEPKPTKKQAKKYWINGYTIGMCKTIVNKNKEK